MGNATMSVMGMYKYYPRLFSQLKIPTGLKPELFINRLCYETAGLEVLFSSPPIFENVIGLWCDTNIDRWQKIYDTTQLDYNPIENYDRQEEWEDNSKTASTVDSHDTGTGKNSAKDTQRKAAFDAGSMVDSDSGENSSESESTQTGHSAGESTEQSTHKARIHGNIGVTTSQQMIEEERKVLEFNMYSYLIQEFKEQFLLLVY